jgi:hypothetical protein
MEHRLVALGSAVVFGFGDSEDCFILAFSFYGQYILFLYFVTCTRNRNESVSQSSLDLGNTGACGEYRNICHFLLYTMHCQEM